MTNESTSQTFSDWLGDFINHSKLENDDIVGITLPLVKQVAELHKNGQVAPLFDIDKLFVSLGHIWFANQEAKPAVFNKRAIQAIDTDANLALAVVEELRENEDSVENLLLNTDAEIKNPVYLPHFDQWELRLEHQDELTDIFGLGMIISSVALNLDLADRDSLRRFIDQRHNLFTINPRLHPVLAKLLVQMTELKRHQRIQDITSIIHVLGDYRSQVVDQVLDWNQQQDFASANQHQQQDIILGHLRNRLFEISRRNRLLYFKPTLAMLNLTEASVPLLLNLHHICADKLFTWHKALVKKISAGNSIPLNNYLRIEDAPYIPGILNRIQADDRRNRNEYGFSQLRLAFIFLRWHNLKDDKEERITSPLLLLPVKLEKKKGVRDQFILTPLACEAEVNPVLRHHLHNLYGFVLPETVELTLAAILDLHQRLSAIIQTSEPGITLRLIDKPEISLIHKRAKARLDQYNRRRRVSGRGIRTYQEIDYCYNSSNFQPLGLQLFLRHVKPLHWPLQAMVDAAPAPRTPLMNEPDPTAEKVIDKTFYTLDSGNSNATNPYTWDFDLCHCTLGNFNYRKMSLVRDYTCLIEQEHAESEPFTKLFSLIPRPHDPADNAMTTPLPVVDDFSVVMSDPTQAATVSKSREPASFVIQGPPGTGKSQSITNLIADFVVRQKRVLFVCEKRAAIDVVFHRLKQQHLSDLCCLIHDSQNDKKAFIADLKKTYNHYSNNVDEAEKTLNDRERLTMVMQKGIDKLARIKQKQLTYLPEYDATIRDLIARAIEIQPSIPELDEYCVESLPSYSLWKNHSDAVNQVHQVFSNLEPPAQFGTHIFRLLSANLLNSEQPLMVINGKATQVKATCSHLNTLLDDLPFMDNKYHLQDIETLCTYARQLTPLVKAGLLPLLTQDKPLLKVINKQQQQRQSQRKSLAVAQKRNASWLNKIPEDELADVLTAVIDIQSRPWRFLSLTFWRLWSIFQRCYNFKAHTIQPSWENILKRLELEYHHAAKLRDIDQQFETDYGFTNVTVLNKYVADLQDQKPNHTCLQQQLHEYLLNNPAEAAALLETLRAAQQISQELQTLLSAFSAQCMNIPLNVMQLQFQELLQALSDLPVVISELKQLVNASPELFQLAASNPWMPEQMEGALLQAALQKTLQQDHELSHLTRAIREETISRLNKNETKLLTINAKYIQNLWHHRFLKKVALSGLPATQLTEAQKIWKKDYNKGRKLLEHEFGKTMRYKSIRDICLTESGEVVSDLKPIWLMSPLSVSDALPLDANQFDVVIFDEASQITLEEAIPALFRAPHAIVVGDQQQLPPSDFFAAKQHLDEDLFVEADDQSSACGLDADSFLNQAAKTLPSTMLGWHYRSRSESLISFSNALFYQYRLLTIPDQQLCAHHEPIKVDNPEQAQTLVQAVLDRPISFHYQTNGVYHNRRNTAEATYIACLLRQLFLLNTNLTIGIVAFSEAQQGEIEGALERLAEQDKKFGKHLEDEFEREEDDQFCGLFIKNLENVQGDERDIIIVSICYGPDPQGRIKMNFGPINRSGGEKRLNVIFSRARQHMVVVSSMYHDRITNDYNDGANCLKRYLRYAEIISTGDNAAAQQMLLASCSNALPTARPQNQDAVVQTIGRTLKQRGWIVEYDVGHSHFRCDIAIRRPSDQHHRHGLLLDTGSHYENPNIKEQYLQRPKILRAFGWRILMLHAKDWFDDQGAILALLEQNEEEHTTAAC